MTNFPQQKSDSPVVILGAGPAGLTAAKELLDKGEKVIIIERNDHVGGISATINHNENRIDIGGHRFFSKNDYIIDWWLNILPLHQDADERSLNKIAYRGQFHQIQPASIENNNAASNQSMLIRKRKSRIFFNNKLYDYPLKPSLQLLSNLGVFYSVKVIFSYIYAKIRFLNYKKFSNLEEFIISRFGNKLYQTFFKSYTEKVWGKKCHELSADWGKQRIKNLSLLRTMTDYFIKKFLSTKKNNIETSLIEYFLYPSLGPGQLWERVADIIQKKGGVLSFNSTPQHITIDNNNVTSISYITPDGVKTVEPKAIMSSIAVDELIKLIGPSVPDEIMNISQNLDFRSFITVGLLFDKTPSNSLFDDNWIYIHSNDVKVGRIQFFNNWSPYMVSDSNKIWIGLEYFCSVSDELWNLSDSEISQLAAKEIAMLKIVPSDKYIDTKVIRVKKAYPSYWGSYSQFDILIEYFNKIDNLFPMGRNGMHRYNNQDHSMETAMESVKVILGEKSDKAAIWNVNSDEDYHENK